MANLSSPLKPAEDTHRETVEARWRRDLRNDLILGYSLVLAVALLAGVLYLLLGIPLEHYLPIR